MNAIDGTEHYERASEGASSFSRLRGSAFPRKH